MDLPANSRDLHGSILMNILVKLPLKSVITCKLVCKYWYHLISDSSFGQSYNHVKTFEYRLFFNSSPDLYLNETNGNEVVKTSFNLKLHLPTSENEILGTVGLCNGLFCFLVKTRIPVGEIESTVYVYNPLTCEYVVISKRGCVLYDFLHVTPLGFGCSKYTNQYKVVSVLDGIPPGSRSQGQVITVGVDSRWREYGGDPCIGCLISSKCPILFNGVLHWMGYVISSPKANVIYAFDIEDEKGETMELPIPLQSTRVPKPCIGILNDHLCAIPRGECFCVWIMKDYRVVESWTKYISFEDPIPRNSFLFNHGFVFDIFASNGEGESIFIHGQAVSYVPCFSSLKNVLKGV